jgi:hypothetical protein
MKYIILFLLTSCYVQAQDVKDYNTAFNNAIALGFKMDMPLDTVKTLFKTGFETTPDSSDIRIVYQYDPKQYGLDNITFYFDKDGNQPLYAVFLQFSDADTLAAFCQKKLGTSDHPGMEDHWIIALDAYGIATLFWRDENFLVMANNLPETELFGMENFDLGKVFIAEHVAEQNGGLPSEEVEMVIDSVFGPPDKELTNTINTIIAYALLDFEGMKDDPIPGKMNEYQALLSIGDDPENTIIRKNVNDTWRLESKIATKVSLEEAQNTYYTMQIQLENLEALEYRLLKKSEYTSNTANTYIWEIESLDGDDLGVIMKLQLYYSGDEAFSVRFEVGR